MGCGRRRFRSLPPPPFLEQSLQRKEVRSGPRRTSSCKVFKTQGWLRKVLMSNNLELKQRCPAVCRADPSLYFHYSGRVKHLSRQERFCRGCCGQLESVLCLLLSAAWPRSFAALWDSRRWVNQERQHPHSRTPLERRRGRRSAGRTGR